MMAPPLPLKLTGATVRLQRDLVTVRAHELNIQHRLPKLMAEAVWERLGVGPEPVEAVEVSGEAAEVDLERGGIRIRFGALSAFRPVLYSYWRFLHVRELAERGVAHVA